MLLNYQLIIFKSYKPLMAIHCSYIFIILQKSQQTHPFVGCNFSVVTCLALVASLASWAVTLDSFTPFIMKLVKFPWDTHKIFGMAARQDRWESLIPFFKGPPMLQARISHPRRNPQNSNLVPRACPLPFPWSERGETRVSPLSLQGKKRGPGNEVAKTRASRIVRGLASS